MAWFGPDGQQMYFEDTGRGDAVLLLPGWAGSIAEFGGLRRELAGFRVIAADLPGSGRSQPQPRHYGPGYYADDARSLLSLLDDRGVAAAHLVGFSDGGEEALLMAALQPRRALSVLTWGAAGQIVASPGQLDALGRAIDNPTGPLAPLAAYLADAYGPAGARIMTRNVGGSHARPHRRRRRHQPVTSGGDHLPGPADHRQRRRVLPAWPGGRDGRRDPARRIP